MTNIDIYQDILKRDPNKKRTYVILGRSGPTGKTWLCCELKKLGYNAVDISEALFHTYAAVQYADSRNHYEPNRCTDIVTIILNEPLERKVP